MPRKVITLFFNGTGENTEYPNLINEFANDLARQQEEGRSVCISYSAPEKIGSIGQNLNYNVTHALNTIIDELLRHIQDGIDDDLSFDDLCREENRLIINLMGHSRGGVSMFMLCNQIEDELGNIVSILKKKHGVEINEEKLRTMMGVNIIAIDPVPGGLQKSKKHKRSILNYNISDIITDDLLTVPSFVDNLTITYSRDDVRQKFAPLGLESLDIVGPGRTKFTSLLLPGAHCWGQESVTIKEANGYVRKRWEKDFSRLNCSVEITKFLKEKKDELRGNDTMRHIWEEVLTYTEMELRGDGDRKLQKKLKKEDVENMPAHRFTELLVAEQIFLSILPQFIVLEQAFINFSEWGTVMVKLPSLVLTSEHNNISTSKRIDPWLNNQQIQDQKSEFDELSEQQFLHQNEFELIRQSESEEINVEVPSKSEDSLEQQEKPSFQYFEDLSTKQKEIASGTLDFNTTLTAYGLMHKYEKKMKDMSAYYYYDSTVTLQQYAVGKKMDRSSLGFSNLYYSPNSSIFINGQERDLFKKNYPNLFQYCFSEQENKATYKIKAKKELKIMRTTCAPYYDHLDKNLLNNTYPPELSLSFSEMQTTIWAKKTGKEKEGELLFFRSLALLTGIHRDFSRDSEKNMKNSTYYKDNDENGLFSYLSKVIRWLQNEEEVSPTDKSAGIFEVIRRIDTFCERNGKKLPILANKLLQKKMKLIEVYTDIPEKYRFSHEQKPQRKIDGINSSFTKISERIDFMNTSLTSLASAKIKSRGDRVLVETIKKIDHLKRSSLDCLVKDLETDIQNLPKEGQNIQFIVFDITRILGVMEENLEKMLNLSEEALKSIDPKYKSALTRGKAIVNILTLVKQDFTCLKNEILNQLATGPKIKNIKNSTQRINSIFSVEGGSDDDIKEEESPTEEEESPTKEEESPTEEEESPTEEEESPTEEEESTTEEEESQTEEEESPKKEKKRYHHNNEKEDPSSDSNKHNSDLFIGDDVDLVVD